MMPPWHDIDHPGAASAHARPPIDRNCTPLPVASRVHHPARMRYQIHAAAIALTQACLSHAAAAPPRDESSGSAAVQAASPRPPLFPPGLPGNAFDDYLTAGKLALAANAPDASTQTIADLLVRGASRHRAQRPGPFFDRIGIYQAARIALAQAGVLAARNRTLDAARLILACHRVAEDLLAGGGMLDARLAVSLSNRAAAALEPLLFERPVRALVRAHRLDAPMRPLGDIRRNLLNELTTIELIIRGRVKPPVATPELRKASAGRWASGLRASWERLLAAPFPPGHQALVAACRAQPASPYPRFCAAGEELLAEAHRAERTRQNLQSTMQVSSQLGARESTRKCPGPPTPSDSLLVAGRCGGVSEKRRPGAIAVADGFPR
jgi:hypothetical protein